MARFYLLIRPLCISKVWGWPMEDCVSYVMSIQELASVGAGRRHFEDTQ